MKEIWLAMKHHHQISPLLLWDGFMQFLIQLSSFSSLISSFIFNNHTFSLVPAQIQIIFTILPSAFLTVSVYILSCIFSAQFTLSKLTLVQLSNPVPHIFNCKNKSKTFPYPASHSCHRLPFPLSSYAPCICWIELKTGQHGQWHKGTTAS